MNLPNGNTQYVKAEILGFKAKFEVYNIEVYDMGCSWQPNNCQRIEKPGLRRTRARM